MILRFQPIFFFFFFGNVFKDRKAAARIVYWPASLEGKTLADISPPPLHIDATRLQFDCFSSQQQLLAHLSPPMKPVSVMTPALAPAVMFCFAFVLESPLLLILMFMLVLRKIEGTSGFWSISLVHK